MKNNLNIYVEDESVPIYVTKEEAELYENAIVVEDVRNTYAHRKWSKLVKEMHNYTCKCCGTNEDLESHHVLSFKHYPVLRIDLNNGVCLCRKCHRSYHSEYDLKNSRTSTLLDFIRKEEKKRVQKKRRK